MAALALLGVCLAGCAASARDGLLSSLPSPSPTRLPASFASSAQPAGSATPPPAPVSAAPRISPATDAAAAGLVDVQGLVEELQTDMRYAGSHNFVGAPIDGYDAPKCLLLRPVADAVARVARSLHAKRQRLLVYDCYRPVRAVAHFMRWAKAPGALAGKAEFFPTLDKSALVPQYIAEHSGHSRGATIDLALLQCDARGERCVPLDMGTAFDWFGERAHTDSPSVTAAQRANRHALRDAMRSEGFANYADEWWHYTLKPEPLPLTAFDVPIR